MPFEVVLSPVRRPRPEKTKPGVCRWGTFQGTFHGNSYRSPSSTKTPGARQLFQILFLLNCTPSLLLQQL